MESFLGYDKKEVKGVVLILSLLILFSFSGFVSALRKSRDAQRKSDIRAMSNAINKYQDEFGFIPSSRNGKIAACDGGRDVKGYPIFIACEFGKDELGDINDPKNNPYLTVLPIDPQNSKGVNYLYISNGRRYQIYASLEGHDEAEYSKKIEARGLKCGTRKCNFGLSSGSTPLEKSIEEYENELLKKKEK